MRMISLGVLVVTIGSMSLGLEVRADEIEGFHATVTPYVGTTVWAENLGLEDKLLGGARFGLMLNPSIGVEGTWGVSHTETDFLPTTSVDMTHFGVDFVYNIFPRQRVIPYLLGGWSQLIYGSVPANPRLQEGKLVGFEFGGGLKIGLSQPGGLIALRLDVRDVVTRLSEAFPGYDSTEHNVLVALGLQFALGGTSSHAWKCN